MADTEFEEFRKTFERLPTNYKSATPFYSIVPHLDDDSPSSKSDSSDQDDESQQTNLHQNSAQKLPFNIKSFGCIGSNSNNSNSINIKTNNDGEDDEIGDGLRTINGGFVAGIEGGNGGNFIGGTIGQIVSHSHHHINHLERTNSLPFMPEPTTERRRRKLPEIPKNKKSSLMLLCGQTPVADDLRHQQQQFNNSSQQHNIHQQQQPPQSNLISSYTSPMPSQQRSILAFKCSYLLDEDSSPDSDRLHSFGDVDSGHSTAHSPNDFKSMSPALASSPHSPFPPPFGGVPFSQLEMLEATHRGLHKFIPRHHDEIDIEIGDPIYVQKEADDLWCEGVNLRTGRQGIFPSAYAVDLEYNDFDPNAQKVKKERYLLGYLGSVETMAHKGTGVVCQAVRKIVGEYGDSPNGQCCILEISDQGLHMVERSTSQGKEKKKPCIDYFYSLKNVSFCAFHPRDHRYIGFITKHPTIHRFACHVFKGNESTRPVAEAVGRAFQHFYQKFIEKAYPIEDIYIE